LKGVFHAGRENAMSASTATPFASLLREFRERSGLSQSNLAFYLKVDASIIKGWEDEDKEPSWNLAFYERFRKVPGITDYDIARLWVTSLFSNTEWEYKPPAEPQPFRIDAFIQSISEIQSPYPQIGLEEEPQDTLTESSQTGASIPDEEAPNALKENPGPIHYPHMLPDHGTRIVAEGKWGEKQQDRLMTLKEAAGLYPDDVSYSDLLRWHYSGRLEEKGRRWLARPGGRSIPLVSQAQVAYLKDHRPPVGVNISKRRKSGSRRNQ
jgi:DNA-binding XRE family transcriptional regulator